MADAAAAAPAPPSHAEMIAEMKKAGYVPPQQPQSADPTHDQMIAEMKAAGFSPDAPDNWSLSAIGNRLGNLADKGSPLLNRDAETFSDAAKGVGTVAITPQLAAPLGAAVGTAVGAPNAGAGIAGGLASATNDLVNNPDKPLKDVAVDAVAQGGQDAAFQFAGGKAIEGLGKAGVWVAGKILPKTVIAKFAAGAEVIQKIWDKAGGDQATAAETVRATYGKSLDATRTAANDQISNALKSSNKTIDMTSVLEKLQEARNAINPKLNPDKVAPFDTLITRIKNAAGMTPSAPVESGLLDEYGKPIIKQEAQTAADATKVPVKLANDIKQTLQDEATAAYRNIGEFAKTGAKDFATAAKKAGALARKNINDVVPEIAAANNRLAQMHWIEDRMNLNLIRQGKSPAALLAAGEGKNPMNAAMLKKLGDLTGTDMLGQAQSLAAANKLGPITPLSFLSPKEAPMAAVKYGMTLGQNITPPMANAVTQGAAQGLKALGGVVSGNTGVDMLREQK